MSQLRERQREMSEAGYILNGSSFEKEMLTTHWTRQPELLTTRPTAPPGVAAMREELKAVFPRARARRWNPAARSETRNFSEIPTSEFLSAKNIHTLRPGGYSYTVVVGEAFIRLGSSHPIMSAGEPSEAAGDLFIGPDPVTGEQTVLWINPRSDTYMSPDDSLLSAVEAMWAQGIYPSEIWLRSWDNEKTLFRSKMPK